MLVKLTGSSEWHWKVLNFFISMHFLSLTLSWSASLPLCLFSLCVLLSVFLYSFSLARSIFFFSSFSLLKTVFLVVRLAEIRAVHLWVWSYPRDKNMGLVQELLQMLKCRRNASMGIWMIHTLNFWGYDEMKHVYFLNIWF